jgi:hypothetical protein
MEILPTQLFFALNGSFSEPYLLPTMSANPEKFNAVAYTYSAGIKMRRRFTNYKRRRKKSI